MRHATLPGVLLCLLLASPAFAQVPEKKSEIFVVKVKSAEVRCAPSKNTQDYYVTNRLPEGTGVVVVGSEEGGWLKIVPPLGSFSYIRAVMVKQIASEMKHYVVTAKDTTVPVFVGSEVHNGVPTAIGSRLVAGTQVIALPEAMMKDADGLDLMRIEPPAKEVRYIRAADVAPGDNYLPGTLPSMPKEIVNERAIKASRAVPARPVSSAAPVAAGASPLEIHRQAEAAFKTGRYDEAIELYGQLARATATSDTYVSSQSTKMVAYLQAQLAARRDVAAGPMPPAAKPTMTAVGTGSTVPTESAYGTRGQGNQARAAVSQFRQAKGVLRKSFRAPIPELYMLVDPRYETPLCYVQGSAAAPLDRHVGRTVTVHGNMFYSGELRSNYLTATQVYPE